MKRTLKNLLHNVYSDFVRQDWFMKFLILSLIYLIVSIFLVAITKDSIVWFIVVWIGVLLCFLVILYIIIHTVGKPICEYIIKKGKQPL